MSEIEKRFHERWLAMVAPIEGLVLSVPVLTDAQTMLRQGPQLQERLRSFVTPTFSLADTRRFFANLLGFSDNVVDEKDLDPALSLYVVEGRETLRPSFALRRQPTA